MLTARPLPALSWADGVLIIRVSIILDALGWAVTLALPGSTFEISPVYALMQHRMPEWAWSLAFAAEAAACAYGLWRPPGLWRSLAPVGAAMLYGFVAVSASRTWPLSTGTAAYTVVTLQAYWLIWMEGRASRSRRLLTGLQGGPA